MVKSWIHQGGILLLYLLVGTVSGMDPGTSSISVQNSTLASQLSTLGSQLIHLQEQVEGLQQENMKDKERIVHLEQVTEDFERRVSLLESLCGNVEMETGIHGSLVAIGGYSSGMNLRSMEVLNTSCDFPLPEIRWGHISVTTTDGKTLVCGGRTPSGHTASCLQFDNESQSWKEHSTLQSIHRFLSSAVTLSRGTYVLGGGSGTKSSSEFLATGSSVWTQGPHIPGEGVWNSCAAKLSDTEFVILGGFHDKLQARVYDETKDEWREWPRLTESSWTQSCVGLGDIVLMAGGLDYGGHPTSRTVIFNTKTGSAREVASLNYERARVAMLLYRGKPLILGGMDVTYELRSDGEIWNMDTETWEEADIHLNIARAGLSLVTMAEQIDCD